MKVRDIIKLVESDGWYLIVVHGSHRQYKHPIKSGRVLRLPGNQNHDIAPGTLNSNLETSRVKGELR